MNVHAKMDIIIPILAIATPKSLEILSLCNFTAKLRYKHLNDTGISHFVSEPWSGSSLHV